MTRTKWFHSTVWLVLASVLLFQVAPYAEEESAPEQDPAAAEGEAAAQEQAAPDQEQETAAPAQEDAEPEPVEAPEATLTPLASSESEDSVSQEVVSGGNGLDEKVSLDLRNIEVAEALRFLAQKGGMNMAISKNVSGRVQLLLNNVPIRDIMDIILVANALAYDKHGDVYNIMSDAEYKERYGRKFSDLRVVKVFRLKYAVPDQAFSLFEVLKSDIGRLLVDPESGTVLVMDTPENIQRMQDALAGLEQRKTVKVYSLKYAKALDVETRLKSQLDNKKVGLINADERTNQIIVETLPDRLKDIDQLVYALDQKTREVQIDAKIVKVTLSDNFDAEIQWEGLFSQLNQFGTQFIGNHGLNPVLRTGKGFLDDFTAIAPTANVAAGAKNTLTENLVFGQVRGDRTFEVLLKLLRAIGETKILSNPKISVVNNQEAKIHVGEKQAYVTTTTTTGSGGTTTNAEAVTFVDVGIQLAVTPTINEDGFVTMKIKPEISSVTSFLTTPSGNKIPIIDSSLAETTVMVKDGVSIIIGGLRKDERVISKKRIPVLGDLPIIGAPFRSNSDHFIRTELLILLTPHVVYGDKLTSADNRSPERTPLLPFADYRQPEAETRSIPMSYVDYSGYNGVGELSKKKEISVPVRS